MLSPGIIGTAGRPPRQFANNMTHLAPFRRGFFFGAIDRTYFGMKLKAAGWYSSGLARLIGPVSAGLFLG